MRIQDKVVVITGGASGLGLATAHYLVMARKARVSPSST
jgi:3-hydroxyacyl-CoA dehydrogenase/3-hydroxy-2-methylbutyryl-CoA dehydrogenase